MSFHANIAVGYGKAHASFGEILQGRDVSHQDFLVTMPVDMWSICNLTCIERSGPLVINCEYNKSLKVAEMLLDKLGIHKGYELTISFSRNIPVGKGLSSSTADMLSTVRALQEIFGFLLREKTISEIFTDIEPHDGLMYKSCVVYNHRKGTLIKELLHIPQYSIVAIDFGGQLNTVEYNHRLTFSEEEQCRFSSSLEELERAFDEKDDERIARMASEATRAFFERNNDTEKLAIIEKLEAYEPLGLINTHSGTCLGLVFSSSMSKQELNDIASRISRDLGLSVFITKTLKLLI